MTDKNRPKGRLRLDGGVVWASCVVSCVSFGLMFPAAAGAQPTVVVGGEVYEYATFPSRHARMSFDAADNLYVGNFNDAGRPDEPAHVYRVSASDSSVTTCGPMIDDPDAVHVDRDGIFGEPGSVLVGGLVFDGPGAHITQLDADCSSALVLSTDECLGNVSSFAEDSEGRLYVGHAGQDHICVHDGGEWSEFVTVGSTFANLAIESENIYVSWEGRVRLFDTNGTLVDSAFAMGGVVGIGPPGPFEGVIVARADSLLAVNPETEQETALVVDLANGAGQVEFDSAGDMYIAQSSVNRVLHVTQGAVTSVGHQSPGASAINLSPNPFSSTTFVSFHLSERTMVRLRVYDVNGRLVRTLIDRSVAPGLSQVPFPADELSSGTYFLRGRVGGPVIVRKMHVIR